MKRRRIVYIFSFIMLLLLTSYSVYAVAPKVTKKEERPMVGFYAPNFTLDNLQGNAVKLSQYRGYPVFLNFWATWCPPCRAEMPLIEKLSKDKKIKVVTINLQEKKGDVKQFIKNKQYSFQVLLDSDGNVSDTYEIRAIPTTFLLNKDGKIIDMNIGSLSENRLEKMFSKI